MCKGLYSILFAEISLDQTIITKDILQALCESSGQKVSHGKTRIYFSKNVNWEIRQSIAAIVGSHTLEDLDKVDQRPCQISPPSSS